MRNEKLQEKAQVVKKLEALIYLSLFSFIL